MPPKPCERKASMIKPEQMLFSIYSPSLSLSLTHKWVTVIPFMSFFLRALARCLGSRLLFWRLGSDGEEWERVMILAVLSLILRQSVTLEVMRVASEQIRGQHYFHCICIPFCRTETL